MSGVDISDTAIDVARRLFVDAGVPATFHRADMYDWQPGAAQEGLRFDRVFSSYGAIGWLSDLAVWARGIASVLAPGGRLLQHQMHALTWVSVNVRFSPTAGMTPKSAALACSHQS